MERGIKEEYKYMLENLHVKDLALIEEADIDFGRGFNVLTGETGAGKSIILGSINLALGAKASSDVIRTGKESSLIELSFSLNDDQIAKVREAGIEVSEDGELLLQRKIMPGKSVCRVNGETVSVGQLKELSGTLLNMYGQHEHQTLLKASTYSKMLDEYAGEDVFSYLLMLKEELTKYKDLKSKLDNQETDDSIRSRELELLEFEVNEIESASLKEGEDEELEKRYRFLSNVRKIMENVSKAHSMTGEDNDVNAELLIGSASSLINQISSFDEEAMELSEQIASIEDLLRDFNRALSNYEGRLNFDEGEYREVEDRLNVINKLKDKYGGSIEKIYLCLEEKSKKIEELQNFEEFLRKLEKDIDDSRKKLLLICENISKLRTKASKVLVEKLIKALGDLNFLDVKMEIKIIPDEENITANGYDNVEFLISLNPGEDLRPMQNIASGGELSRIMLAFKSVFADSKDLSTLIFDEIDAGISGVTAYKVSEKMRELSSDHQIICITHLPQIAAMADSHFLIKKGVMDGRTVTNISSLDEDGSVSELARMLGSDELSESALANARELRLKAKR